MLFSLAPLAIVLVSIFGLVLQDDEIREDVTDRIVDALPVDAATSEDVESAIEAIATPASAAGLVSLAVFLWAASGMMAALRTGLEATMGVPRSRPAARAKLVDLALVGATALLVLIAVGAGVLVDLAGEAVSEASAAVGLEGGAAETVLSLALPLLLWTATSLCLYRFVPDARLRLPDALAGAIASAVGFLAISLASDLVYSKTTDWSLVYGSLTSLLVFLYSVYLYASVLLLGAAIAAEWSREVEPSQTALRVRARLALRNLFVRHPRDG